MAKAASGRGVAVRIKFPPPILQRQPATPVVVGRRTPTVDVGSFDADLCIANVEADTANRRVEADLAAQYVDGNVLLLPVVGQQTVTAEDHNGDNAPPASRLEPSVPNRAARRVPGSHFPDPTILPLVPLPSGRSQQQLP